MTPTHKKDKLICIGRIYQVYVDGKPILLVGSTSQTLARRCKSSGTYIKRFGPTVELRLLEEVYAPDYYDELRRTVRLRDKEDEWIKTLRTMYYDGGLNQYSPVTQAMWDSKTAISERGHLGGVRRGRELVESGEWARIQRIGQRMGGKAGGKINGPIQGRKNVESGQAYAVGKILGRKNVENGHLTALNHQRWHVKRYIINPKCSLCTSSSKAA